MLGLVDEPRGGGANGEGDGRRGASEDPGGDGEDCQTDGDDATDGGNGSGTMDDIHLSVDGDDDADVDRGI